MFRRLNFVIWTIQNKSKSEIKLVLQNKIAFNFYKKDWMIQIKYDSSDFMNILWKINNSDFGSAEKNV